VDFQRKTNRFGPYVTRIALILVQNRFQIRYYYEVAIALIEDWG
jgi:hypothetical protein